MEKLSMKKFEERYGEPRAIAALAVIMEEEKGKKRLRYYP